MEEGMKEKRGFSTQEAQQYLGVKRRFFDNCLLPMRRDKGIRAGTSVIYERVDLDAAWDAYKGLQTVGHDKVKENLPMQRLKRKTCSRGPAAVQKPSASVVEVERFADV